MMNKINLGLNMTNILFYLLIINLIGYGIMWYDKICAQIGAWRVKEKTLLIISLIGGSIGILIGMFQFRHKTRHIKFKYGIPFIIFIQVLLIMAFMFKWYYSILQILKNYIKITQ